MGSSVTECRKKDLMGRAIAVVATTPTSLCLWLVATHLPSYKQAVSTAVRLRRRARRGAGKPDMCMLLYQLGG